jgi:hypothetical protein
VSFYCGCTTTTKAGVPINAHGASLDHGVVLPRPMTCVKTGAEQFLVDGSQHYPNVDVFECPNCKLRVVRE